MEKLNKKNKKFFSFEYKIDESFCIFIEKLLQEICNAGIIISDKNNFSTNSNLNNFFIFKILLPNQEKNEFLKLIISSKDFYLQGFINKNNYYFYFNDSIIDSKIIEENKITIEEINNKQKISCLKLNYSSNYSSLEQEYTYISKQNIEQTILNLWKYENNKKNNIKQDLLKIIFFTSEALRFPLIRLKCEQLLKNDQQNIYWPHYKELLTSWEKTSRMKPIFKKEHSNFESEKIKMDNENREKIKTKIDKLENMKKEYKNKKKYNEALKIAEELIDLKDKLHKLEIGKEIDENIVTDGYENEKDDKKEEISYHILRNNIKDLDIQFIPFISTKEIYELTPLEIKSLSKEQIQAFRKEQIQFLKIEMLEWEQLNSLTDEQINSILKSNNKSKYLDLKKQFQKMSKQTKNFPPYRKLLVHKSEIYKNKQMPNGLNFWNCRFHDDSISENGLNFWECKFYDNSKCLSEKANFFDCEFLGKFQPQKNIEKITDFSKLDQLSLDESENEASTSSTKSNSPKI